MQSTQTSEQEQRATPEDLAWLEQETRREAQHAEREDASAEQCWEDDQGLLAATYEASAANSQHAAERLRRIAATVRAALG